MKVVLIFAAAMAYVSFAEKDRLSGRWETKPSPKGNVTGVVFK